MSVFFKSSRSTQAFLCHDLLGLYECLSCDYTTPLKTQYYAHHCGFGDDCDKPIFQRCSQCGLGSFSILWRYYHQKCRFIEKSNYPTKISRNDRNWPRLHYCDQCGYETIYKFCLRRHINLKHTSVVLTKWHQCDECEFKGFYTSSLNKHKILKHTLPQNYKWFQCSQCTHKTLIESDLIIHTNMKHSKKSQCAPEQNLQCDHCEYTALNRHEFRKHITRTHVKRDGQPMFQCNQCKFQTVYKKALKRHINNEHIPNRMKNKSSL